MSWSNRVRDWMKTNSLFKRRLRGPRRRRRGMLNFLVSSPRPYPSMSKNCLNAEVHAKRKYMSVQHWETPHNQAPSTLMCFVWKRIHFYELRLSVHTFSSKTHRFENALKSGSKRKRIHIVLVWTDKNAWQWKRWPKISQARVLVACA